MDESSPESSLALDLSQLTDFRFGPDWARKDFNSPAGYARYADKAPRGGRADFRRNGEGRRPRDARSSDRPPRRNAGKPDGRPSRYANGANRPRRELPQPAEGLRVEVRPGNAALSLFATEIQRSKRVLSLMDLARVVVSKRDRFDIVFMTQENGPIMYHSAKEDGSCWLSREEALAYLPHAPWFSEFYSVDEVQVEPPKGSFTGIAVCSLGGEVVGPVNWHGYQPTLAALYKSKYSSMPLRDFRASIKVDKDEETVQKWLSSASTQKVWHPTREPAEQEPRTTFSSMHEVQEDFMKHHFAEVFKEEDKVFINASTSAKKLSPGLAAYVSILSGKYLRSPQILIPNLCHGLARHRMPIFKWKGHHYTGPSRLRAVPADTALADRMAAIVKWAAENPGKKTDVMLAELTGVRAGGDEESKKAAQEAYDPYTADMIWLMEQGFIIVTSDNSVWLPKTPLAQQTTAAEEKEAAKKEKDSPQTEEEASSHEEVSSSPAETEKEKQEEPAPTQEQPAAEEASSPPRGDDAGEPCGGEREQRR